MIVARKFYHHVSLFIIAVILILSSLSLLHASLLTRSLKNQNPRLADYINLIATIVEYDPAIMKFQVDSDSFPIIVNPDYVAVKSGIANFTFKNSNAESIQQLVITQYATIKKESWDGIIREVEHNKSNEFLLIKRDKIKFDGTNYKVEGINIHAYVLEVKFLSQYVSPEQKLNIQLKAEQADAQAKQIKNQEALKMQQENTQKLYTANKKLVQDHANSKKSYDQSLTSIAEYNEQTGQFKVDQDGYPIIKDQKYIPIKFNYNQFSIKNNQGATYLLTIDGSTTLDIKTCYTDKYSWFEPGTIIVMERKYLVLSNNYKIVGQSVPIFVLNRTILNPYIGN